MDPLTALLDVPRARDAFLLRVTMAPPWSTRIEDRAPLAVVALTAGSAWYVPEDGDPVAMDPGDLLLVAGAAPYVIASGPDVQPQAVIHPLGRCETPDGVSLELPLRHGVRTWGNNATGRDQMLVGTYPPAGEIGSRLLRALPSAFVVRSGGPHQALVDLVADEIHGSGVGQASLLDRLLDALTVAAIQHWATRPEASPPGWVRAAGDPVVHQALDLMHDHVVEPWTVESLARRVGMSRAGFSRRFAAAVGEPPMAYLTSWRLALAADLLRHDELTVARVAAEVGYSSPFTFSSAFKRHHGLSPQRYRRRLGAWVDE